MWTPLVCPARGLFGSKSCVDSAKSESLVDSWLEVLCGLRQFEVLHNLFGLQSCVDSALHKFHAVSRLDVLRDSAGCGFFMRLF